MIYNIIWLTWINPFRPHADGGSEDIRRRILALSQKSHNINLFCVDRKSELINRKTMPDNVNLQLYSRHLDPRIYRWNLPIPSLLRYDRKMIFDIKSAIGNSSAANVQQIVILEGLQLVSLWRDIRSLIEQRSICILRMHNLESEYHQSVAIECHGLRKLGHKVSSLQYKYAEQRFFKDFDFIYSVSQSEIDVVKNKYPEISDKLRWVPPIPDGRLLSQINKNDDDLFVICYFGDLTLPNNNGGLHWFCSNVLPLLDKNRLLLRVAGKGSEKFSHYDNVEAFGFVDSIDDFVSNSHLIIAPIFSGAGVKIKVLDAIATGKPLLTSPKGCEGLSPDVIERMNVADHYQEWISTINHISNSYSQVCNASLLLREVLMTHHGSQNFLDQSSKDVDIYNKSSTTMIEKY